MENEMTHTHLLPNDVLANGTKVVVGNKFGAVISHEIKQAHPCGLITVHSIEITSKRLVGVAKTAKYVDVKPYIIKPNYSHVRYKSLPDLMRTVHGPWS